MGPSVFCNKCGWGHFEVTAEHVRNWQEEWAELCRDKPEDWLANYGIQNRQPPDPIQEFCRCHRCGNDYRDFGDVGHVPSGSTITGILRRQDTLQSSEAEHVD